MKFYYCFEKTLYFGRLRFSYLFYLRHVPGLQFHLIGTLKKERFWHDFILYCFESSLSVFLFGAGFDLAIRVR